MAASSTKYLCITFVFYCVNGISAYRKYKALFYNAHGEGYPKKLYIIDSNEALLHSHVRRGAKMNLHLQHKYSIA